MPPQQPFRPAPTPPQPGGGFTPQAPHFDYNTRPDPQRIQQHPSGHYEVLPPLPTASNDGHSGHNQYDFIMQPNSGPRVGGGLLSGSGFFMRIGLLVGGVVVLLIIAGVAITKLSPKGNTQGMISIAQRQQELIRVATAGTQKTTSSDAQNFVMNVEVTMTSSQQGVLNYLSLNGNKVNPKILSLDDSPATDTELTNALSANNYDSAITQNLTEQLQEYESLIKTTYKQSTGPHAKALLQSDYNGAQLLLTEASNLTTELNG